MTTKTAEQIKLEAEQEALMLEKFTSLADTIDGFISASPNIRQLNEVDTWLREMQSLAATLADQCARAEGFFSVAVMDSIEMIPEPIWKRIGKSSTLTTQYVAGMYEKRYVAWKRLENLKSLIKTVMDNTRTMIVSVREEKRTDDAGIIRNSAPFPEPPKDSSNVPWPTNEPGR